MENMHINNPFQINDWEIKRYLIVILSIQLALWGVTGLEVIGLRIPIIPQLIGFVYLTCVPGIVILRILKLHKLGNVETLLYTVGLSIATLMFIGSFINLVYPLFGISGPILTTPLIITISVVVLGLCYISYQRDKDFFDPSFIEIKDIVSPIVLFLSLIPFMSIAGTYLVNFYHNNIILMVMIGVIALTPLLITFNKFIPKNLYPLTVFVIALSLLYHNSLISMYLWGYDIHTEYYLSNLVTTTAQWDSTIPAKTNAMLSIVMLAPLFSNICNISLTWVFKIIYPSIFALLPLGLYRVFQKQTTDKIAFLSCFFFMSLFVFYTEMLALARQQIAELFLVLLILLMIDKDMDRMKRAGLFILFAFSLTVSHYGLSYIFMFSLIVVCGLLFLNTWRKDQDNVTEIITTPRLVVLYITFTIAWYMYVSSSSAFDAIVKIGDHIASSIFTEFLNIGTAQGAAIMASESSSPLHAVHKYLHLISQSFIAIGIFTLLVKHKEMKFGEEYAAFSYASFMICFAGIAIPFFASSLNTTRLYQITLIFLASFCVIGGVAFFRMVNHVVRKQWTDRIDRSSLRVLSVFLAIFLLFNTSWVYVIAEDHPMSIALGQEWINECGDAEAKVDFYGCYVPEQDVFGARWLSNNVDNTAKVYADRTRRDNVLTSYGKRSIDSPILSNSTTGIRAGHYIYLGYLNVVEGIGTGPHFYRDFWNMAEISTLIEKESKIYSNGCSDIYW